MEEDLGGFEAQAEEDVEQDEEFGEAVGGKLLELERPRDGVDAVDGENHGGEDGDGVDGADDVVG